jgi:hypothetical protein
MPDIFGDLRNWGQILKQIELLRLAGQLDEHEEGLTRILRYRYNWQLRQAAMRAVPELRNPSKDLFDVLLGIVTDEYCDFETRLLACNAVRDSIRRYHDRREPGDLRAQAAECAGAILGTPQPPVLRKAVEQWLTVKREFVEQAAGA